MESKSSGQTSFPRLTLKRIRKDELEEKNIDSAEKEGEAGAEGQQVKVESVPQESSRLTVPLKKRRYVAPPADESSVKDIPTVQEERVLKQSVAVEEPHQPKAMSFDESEEEQQKRQQKDQQKQQQRQEQPKAALPQSSHGASSSKTMSEPCEDRVYPGTSASSFAVSANEFSNREMWQNTLKKSFNQLETTKVLRDVKLTENQNEILQRCFRALCERRKKVQFNSGRFEKIHKCFDCEFSITHQCLPLDYIQNIPFRAVLTRPMTIMPNRTIICDCGFAFFHAHFKRPRPRPPPVENTYTKYTGHLRKLGYSVDLSCPKCYIRVCMNNRLSDVCCDLTKWDDMDADNRQMFYDAVQNCLHYPPPNTSSLDEFSACRKNCCLLFHRCSGKNKLPGGQSTSPG